MTTPNPYDEVYYPGHYYARTHPARIATMAALYGLETAPVEDCRVLELGCGVGGNLTPMAFQYPGSRSIGVDLSGITIARGQRNVAELELTNIELKHCDIMDVDESFGSFDYIIAHGVYSWVPPEVRERMLAIFKRHLMPRGVAYVSFNAHPFSHMRDLARDIMLYHTRHLKSMEEKITQSRAIMRFVSEAAPPESVHSAVLRDQYNRVMAAPDTLLFHDDLTAHATAFLLHEVVEKAAGYGLQYLSDVDFVRRRLDTYPPGVRSTLEQFPDDAYLERDQFHDFISGTGFRSSLFCHKDVKLQRSIGESFSKLFYLAAPIIPPVDIDLSSAEPFEFKTEEKAAFTVSLPILKAASVCLGRAWPDRLTFDSLLAEASALIGVDLCDVADARNALAETISALVSIGIVTFHRWRPSFATEISERPEISKLARWQAANGPIVVNLLHKAVQIEDGLTRALMQLIDGSRDNDALLEAMKNITENLPSEQVETSGQSSDIDTEIVVTDRERLESALEMLRKSAMFVK